MSQSDFWHRFSFGAMKFGVASVPIVIACLISSPVIALAVLLVIWGNNIMDIKYEEIK